MAKQLTGIEKARAAKAAKAAERAKAALPIDQEGDAPVRNRPRNDIHKPVRDPQRTPTRGGRTIVVGRDGEELTRKRVTTGDIFAIPDDIIPKGWEYQWCAVSVTGNTEILLDQNLMMAENGWRAVPASRYPGRFMPAGYKGNIVRGGQLLMERPKALSDEARAEDLAAAHQLISDRNEALKLVKTKNELGPGFEMGKKYRGTGGDIRMSIDKALDVERPSYELANDDE